MSKVQPYHARCVIFDCDGTLVDSERLCNQALVNIFSRLGGQLSLDECIEHFQGGKIVDILAETRRRTGVTVSIDTLEPMYREECRKLFNAHLTPIAGVPNLLEELTQLGIDMCIASNGPIHKMEHTLSLTKMLHYFEGKLFSGFEASSWKPDPDLLHFAAMNMGYRLQDCVFVDDTARGVQAGLNAGIPTFHYAAPHAPEIKDPRVITLTEMPQLLDYIQAQ
ncbi:6-phosphogluconate phosphatase [Photobacterium lutimaris]|uniref:Phosphatase n=1 Tax=Photobacterium lutimaris TaxID=388278 RepID=A0A2T3IYS1_9GAMM|nr:6-phosphogluconate phosphatase [Photobacterium lutimaris]PSU33738.1 phosphatase [Photobacterium lutimaris]TDR74546.1 HAD superfamily hydrolase (TIGR01509 family) [Photobacterium lutimaris]